MCIRHCSLHVVLCVFAKVKTCLAKLQHCETRYDGNVAMVVSKPVYHPPLPEGRVVFVVLAGVKCINVSVSDIVWTLRHN